MKFVFLILFPVIAFAGLPTKEEQFKISLATVIENATMSDVRPGMVVASPSKSNPDYYFDWVRDTSLTMRAMVDYYELKHDSRTKRMIFTWIDSEIYRQNLPTMTGLGEPKFNVNGSGFSGPWGRPQNDGAALRALAMIKFARILLKEGQQDFVIKKLYNSMMPASAAIKKDLEYVGHNWREHSFDLWEEEKGMHFYTLLAQFTALQEGAILAREMGDGGAADFYQEQRNQIGNKLKEFVDPRVGIVVTKEKSARLDYKNSGLDVAPLLALLHTSPYQKLFPFRSAPVLKYVQTLIDSFNDHYAVNKAYPDLGVAIGRYIEDKYDGYQTSSAGNPWFLSTLALGEYYCLLRNETKNRKLTDLVEKQFNRVLFHSDRQGHLSEQFNQTSGTMQGARDLTWSHNAFMTAMMRCGLI